MGAQIPEARAKRRYEKYFVSRLTDTDGKQMETRHWLESAFDFGYVSKEQISPLLERYIETGRMPRGIIR